MNIVQFIKDVRAELKHVKWPSKRMMIASTIAVILISAAVALYLSGIDLGLHKILIKFAK